MKRLLLLMVCCVGLLAGPTQAEPTVYFRGKKLTLRHFVYGEVTTATRMIGSVNLGYAHGLDTDQEIGVIRSVEGQYIPIGILRMNTVNAGDSRGVYEGELPLRNTDLVIIAARKLDLWTGRTRMDQTVARTLISDRTRGYDTGSVNPRLLRELGKDDDQIHRLPLSMHVNLDLFDSRRPVLESPIIRGAFVPSSTSTEKANTTSEEDRILASDAPTLNLEESLVRFVRANTLGQVSLSDLEMEQLAASLPEQTDPARLRSRLNVANLRIRNLLAP